MPNLEQFINRAKFWCDGASLGYDQSNRWDIRDGGECDCSSLVIHCLREAGFNTGEASYTGNLSRNLEAHGWQRIEYSADNLIAGDILLNDRDHTAVYLGDGKLAEAGSDERGQFVGGQAGDQTGWETRIRDVYDYPWDCVLRFVGGNTVQVWDFNGQENQQWSVEDRGEAVIIRSKYQPDCVLDVFGAEAEQGAPLILWREHGKSNQLWKPSTGDWITFESLLGDFRLDIYGGENANRGAIAELWTPNDSCAQHFHLVAVPDNPEYCYILMTNGTALYALDASLI